MKFGVVFTIFMISVLLTPAADAETTITYQGQLAEDDEPFNGAVDMEFELFDGEPGNNPVSVAGPINIAGVPVSDGLFQVELDFGDAPYEDGLRLRITVDGDELSPWQPVTAAPLSVRSMEGGSLWTAGQHPIFDVDTVFLREVNVGIGTVQPSAQFEVSGEITDTGFFAGDNAGGGFAAAALTPGGNTVFLAGPAGSQAAVFQGDDPVVIATDLLMGFNRTARIGNVEVTGQVEVGDTQFTPDSGGLRTEGSIAAEGDFLAAFGELQMATSSMPGGSNSVCRSTTGNFQSLGFCSSSARYKQYIEELHSATALVDQLRAVSFQWKETGEHDIGLIAEEVAEIDPRLATYDEHGNVQGVKYRHLAAVLVKALQEQRANTSAEIATLQAELDTQRRETAERLAALEALLLDGAEVAAK